jgi:predicted RNase H-like nuclease (RuvC/YqgF family)
METEKLKKQLADALYRIEKLEEEIERVKKNTNAAIRGDAYLIKTLVEHTGCQPPRGTHFTFGTNFDVGHR